MPTRRLADELLGEQVKQKAILRDAEAVARVRRGQLLGKVGNSGNSATPHVHLQVQTTRSFASDGLPFVFKRFRFVGQITSPDLSDEILGLRPDGLLPFAPATNPGTRRNQMPLDRSVVRFPNRH